MLPRGVIEVPRVTRQSFSQYTERSFRSLELQSFTIISQYVQREVMKYVSSMPYHERNLKHDIECKCQSKMPILNLTTDTILMKRDSISESDEAMSDLSSKVKTKSFFCKKAFSRLISALEKLFLCSELQKEDINLSTGELALFKEILTKKFLDTQKSSYLYAGDSNDSYDLLKITNNIIADHNSTKRVEENNKFIYKYTMKHLRNQFYVNRGIKNSKTSEITFYEHYFTYTAEQMQVPLEHFYDPLYKTLNRNPSYKTINNKYLSLIFTSSQFKTDFFEFLKSQFKRTYMDMVPMKLNKLFKKLISEVSISQLSLSNFNGMIDRFVEKLRRNKKCKLPWTYKEMVCALVQFNSLIYYY